MISVRDLRVDYDTFCAVRDLNLEIQPGEVFGLIGPNGAGKTTTMRALLGLIEPTYGEIRIAGFDVREQPRKACREIGFMPDFPPLYDDLKSWEFLDLFAHSYGIPREERAERVGRALELVNLEEKRDVFVPKLSRGMRQRLMLAKTLIPDPQVLLLDEPASGLDPHGRIDLKRIIKALAAAEKTLLVSSHILSEMSEFCTSVGIMEKGRMVVAGKVGEVQEKVMGRAALQIEILPASEARLRELLSGYPGISKLTKTEANQFECSFVGEQAEAANLLETLIKGDVRVSAFGRKREGLEELFLKVGAREVT